MPANYQVWITNPLGIRLALVEGFAQLNYSRAVNGVGGLNVAVPFGYLPYIAAENRIEVERTLDGRNYYLDLETAWTIRDYSLTLNEQGEYMLVVKNAQDGNNLLASCYIAYHSGTSQSQKTGYADDMMKVIVRENKASTANDYTGTATTRGLPAERFSVQANLSAGPVISKSFAWKQVLETLQEIANESFTKGTYLAFDTVYTGNGKFEFRTYTAQRGVDHRFPGGAAPIILAPELNNLGSVELNYDYSQEANYVYCGGQGEGANRVIKTSADQTRIIISPFNRRELFIDARNSDSPASIQGEADAGVRAGRPRITFNGVILETATTRYGKEYSLGDIVTAQFQGLEIDCRIDAISISVEEKKETITAKLQSVI